MVRITLQIRSITLRLAMIFYFRYAWHNIARGGRWTTLAIFCIAAGVATVVALRSLGLSIGDSLIDNVRVTNKGDISIRQGGGDPFGFGSQSRGNGLSDNALRQVSAWVEANNAQMTIFRTGNNTQIARVDAVTAGRPQFVSSFYIDPLTYPPSHDIRAIEPANVPLSDLLGAGNTVVISENLARQQGIAVGDSVRISGTDQPFTVSGIVAANNEASLNDFFAAFFGFAYFDIETMRAVLDDPLPPNNIAIALPDGTPPEVILSAGDELWEILNRTSGWVRIRTTPRLIENYREVAQILSDLIVVLGLGALLIGGVGIMNTMIVMVRRRTNDIAALKTFGLKGRQVGALFLAEALLLGLIGSGLGIVGGVLLSGVANQYGETFLNQALAWRIYPEALFYGAVLGLLFTVIFGVAPILTTLKVRPAIILRPNETHIPTLGVVQSLALILFVTVAIGLIVGQIVSPSYALVQDNLPLDAPSPYLLGILGVGGVFLFFGLLIALLWGVVWLVGKMPSLGSVDLRLALRNLSTHRLRTAITLLALSAGMFALSSITFVGQGARELLNLQLANQLGGNILVFPLPLATALFGERVEATIAEIAPDAYRTTISQYQATLVAVDGVELGAPSEGRGRFRDSAFDDDDFDTSGLARFVWENMQMITSDNPNLASADIVEGRALSPEDAGQRVLVGPADSAAQLGIRVGSRLTYQVDGLGRADFEVVGLTNSNANFNFGTVTVASGALDNATPEFRFFAYYVPPEQVNRALVELSAIPLIVPLDISFLDQLIARFIAQFTAIPTIVGLLSLLAAAVIMANTVALATLERRRQIGIFKAIGLKGGRVLGIMLIESTLIGLLSALLGLGLSSLIVSGLTSLGGLVIPLPTDARTTALALLLAALGIGWLATFLSARVAVTERVMNVLRYE